MASVDNSSTPAESPSPRRALTGALERLLRKLGSENGSSRGFTIRLFVAMAFTLAVIGMVSYTLIDKALERHQIKGYASVQRADAHAFEREGARAGSQAVVLTEIDRLLDAIDERPGTMETVLIDKQHVVRASGDDRLIGTSHNDPRIDAALLHGRGYEGREGDPGKDGENFEFVTPVNLPDGRFVYETTFDHRAYDEQLQDMQMTLVLVGLLTLIGGGAIFYLLGGRALLRAHRLVLQRATRDGLTDLPNQRAFQDELPQALAAAARYQEPLALAIMDIDDFKFINDRHGHPHGDAVLKRVAAALRQGRPGDRPYRTGGDEFALLLPRTDVLGAGTLASRLSRTLAEAGIEISIGLSSMRPGQTADTLRAEADAALYEAKRRGGNCCAHFEEIRAHVVLTTTDKKDAVRRLIDEGRLSTVFQPIWDLKAGRLVGIEALMRPDPSYGLSGPAEAFDVAEQIGRTHQLDVLCVQSALRVVPELEPETLLFLNLCPQTLDLDAERNDWLRLAVEQAGLALSQVVVEVTERFSGRTASVVKCLQRLRLQGFKTALDDVGTGNSGLEMLRQVHAEFVKIDGSVVCAAPTEPSARAVLIAMATFAKQTGAFVIAEGVEDEETLQYLRSIDSRDIAMDTIIQGAQGYELGRPSPDLPAATRQHILDTPDRGAFITPIQPS